MKFIEFRIAPIENWYSYELPAYNLTELTEWCDNHRSGFNYSLYCIKPLKDKIGYKRTAVPMIDKNGTLKCNPNYIYRSR